MKYSRQYQQISALAALTLIVGAFFVFVSPATATLTLRATNGMGTGSTVTADNGSADSSPLIGSIILTTFGGTLFHMDQGFSKPQIGSVTSPQLDLNVVLEDQVAFNGPLMLTIQLSDTDFSGTGIQNFLATIGGTFDGGPGATITYSIFRDLSNSLFGTGPGTLLCTTGPLSNGPLNVNCPALATVDNAYSLTAQFIFDTVSSTNLSVNSHLARISEPSPVLLLGLSLIGLEIWRRRNRVKNSNNLNSSIYSSG